MSKIQNNSVKHNIKFFFIKILLGYLYKIEEKVLQHAVDKRYTPTDDTKTSTICTYHIYRIFYENRGKQAYR